MFMIVSANLILSNGRPNKILSFNDALTIQAVWAVYATPSSSLFERLKHYLYSVKYFLSVIQVDINLFSLLLLLFEKKYIMIM